VVSVAYDAGVRTARTRACVLLLLLVALAPLGRAGGAEPSRDGRMQELRAAIGEASAEEAAALGELAAIRGRRAELDAAVAGLDSQISAVEARVAALQADVDRFNLVALGYEAQAAELTRQLEEAKRRAEETAAQMYRTEGGGQLYADVLDVDNVRDVYVATKYLSYVSDRRRAEVDALAGLKLQIDELKRAADAQRNEADNARQQAQHQRDELGVLRAEHARQRDEIANEEAREKAVVASIRARRDQFSAELATLQAQSNAINGLLSSRQRTQRRANSFIVARPVPGEVTSGFGARVHPVLGTTRLHNGVDMAGAPGSPIRSAAAGTVVFAGVRGGYGNTVIIDHGNQFSTLYGHASAVYASTGESVAAGERIAAVGSSGLATGPHLHFEVRLLGVPVNPIGYM
jgi:murein DD-endopeptidase MepM/ murein hydrolase activator NlpD